MIKLKLIDADTDIVIEVDAEVLSKIQFFKTMMTKFKEGINSVVNLTVNNVYVVHDIIMGIVGSDNFICDLPTWFVKLETLQFYEYINLDYDFKDLHYIDFPEDSIDNLIATFEITSNKYIIMKLIREYIIKYPAVDLSRFTISTLNEIITMLGDFYLINEDLMWHNNKVRSMTETDIANHHPLIVPHLHHHSYDPPYITDDYYIILSWIGVIIWDLKNRELICEIDGDFEFSACVSPNCKLIVYTYGRILFVYDIANKIFIKKIAIPLKKRYNIKSMWFTSTNNEVVVNLYKDEDDHKMRIVNIETENVRSFNLSTLYDLCKSPLTKYINDELIAYSHDMLYCATVENKSINIVELSTNMVTKINIEFYVRHLTFSPLSDKLIVVCIDCKIRIINTKTDMVEHVINNFLRKVRTRDRVGPVINYLGIVAPNNHQVVDIIKKFV